jgi:hypothetical protein
MKQETYVIVRKTDKGFLFHKGNADFSLEYPDAEIYEEHECGIAVEVAEMLGNCEVIANYGYDNEYVV